MQKLPIVDSTKELIEWYVPILYGFPKDHKLSLGQRMVSVMYDLLDGLISAQHEHKKLPILKSLNVKLDILRCYTQLLFNFKLLDKQVCEFVDVLINQIGNQLGGWIRQREKEEDDSTEK